WGGEGDGRPGPEARGRRPRAGHVADHLVAGHERASAEGEIPLDDVEIGATETAGRDAHENLAGPGVGTGQGRHRQRMTLDGGLGSQNHGAHRSYPPARAMTLSARVRWGASTMCPRNVRA